MDHVNTRLTWTCCFGWWNDKFKQRFVETFRWQGTFGSCESNVSHLWTHWPHLDGWDSLFEAENGLDVIPNCQKKHAKKYKFSVSKLTYSSPPKKIFFFVSDKRPLLTPFLLGWGSSSLVALGIAQMTMRRERGKIRRTIRIKLAFFSGCKFMAKNANSSPV